MNRLIRLVVAACVLVASSAASAQVCQIRGSDRSLGSAVCVGTFDASGDAVFLTAGHCCETESVQLAPEGRWMRGEVLAWAADGPGRDLGIVRVPGYRPRETYRLGTVSPALGDRVLLAGFPEAGPFRETRAEILHSGRGWLAVSAAGVKGVSGGPLLQGRIVVGIATHNDTSRDQCNATNAETIAATLKAWGLAPGARDRSGYVGFGVGMGCGPGGCYRPAVPVYPVAPALPVYPQPYAAPWQQPYAAPYVAAPQTPGYPGWQTPEQRPAGDAGRENPQRPAADATELEALRRRIETSDAGTAAALKDLRAAIGALSLRGGEPGERGPQGPAGPSGPPGPPGRDAAAASLAGVEARLEKLESAQIPVRILDGDGKVIDERKYRLGEALEFRLVPRAK